MPTLTADSSVLTYQDAIERLLSYTNQNGSQANVPAVRQAVLDAYDDLTADRNWRYLARSYRVTQRLQETGTLSYSSSTGEFTIDSGTWPTWADRAILEVDNVRHLIKTRTASTVLTADDTLRPIDDIVTGTAFTIYACIFQLPSDFRRLERPLDEQADNSSQYVDFAGWFQSIRYRQTSGFPSQFAISGDPYEPGRMALLINPESGSERTLDLAYQRFPRKLEYDGVSSYCRAGTIAATASTTLTGTSSQFESGMVGSLVRYGRTATDCPTGRGGLNPFVRQVYIATYASATSITLHEAVTVSGVKYTISDPIDFDRTMLAAFLLGCRHFLAQTLGLATKAGDEREYLKAAGKARGSDSKTNLSRSLWGVSPGNNGGLIRNAIQQVPEEE